MYQQHRPFFQLIYAECSVSMARLDDKYFSLRSSNQQKGPARCSLLSSSSMTISRSLTSANTLTQSGYVVRATENARGAPEHLKMGNSI
jgi:hypothetical protein